MDTKISAGMKVQGKISTCRLPEIEPGCPAHIIHALPVSYLIKKKFSRKLDVTIPLYGFLFKNELEAEIDSLSPELT